MSSSLEEEEEDVEAPTPVPKKGTLPVSIRDIALESETSWPRGCPKVCPGAFGQGCGKQVRFFTFIDTPVGTTTRVNSGGVHSLGQSRGYYGCESFPECKFRWEDVRHGRDCEHSISFSANTLDTFKLELIAPRPTKVGALVSQSGLDEALKKRGIAHEERRDGHELHFAISEYEAVVEAVAGCNLKVLARHLIPAPTLTALRRAREAEGVAPRSEVNAAFARMPEALSRRLLPFQRDGVRFALSRRGRCLIADEMGVGKTVQAIACASCYRQEWPLLVVVPASLRLAWANELERWLPGVVEPKQVHVVFGSEDKLSLNFAGKEPPLVTIVSFKMLEILAHEFLELRFGVVIVDESHNIRSTQKKRDSKQTEAAKRVVAGAKRAILLTGTPSLSKPYDLFAQVNSLRRGLLGKTKQEYSRNYCERRTFRVEGMAWPRTSVSGGRRLQELNLVLSETVMVRRTKQEVAAELPPKRRQVLHLQPTARDIAEASRRVEGGGHEGHEGGGRAEETSYRATGIAKCRQVCEWLACALAGSTRETKFLIFGHHIDVMDEIQFRVLEGAGGGGDGGCDGDAALGYVRIDGSTPALLRQDLVRKFRSDPECKCALLSVTAAGVGLDFSAARIVVFAELPREVSVLEQAEARVHRKGQNVPVNVYFMCARGTTDESLWVHLGTSLNKLKMVHDGEVGSAFAGAGAAPLDGDPPSPLAPQESPPGPATSAPLPSAAPLPTLTTPSEGGGGGNVPYFEVSRHTDRVHLHASPDGSAPLGWNLALDEVESSMAELESAGVADGIDVCRTQELLVQFREEWGVLRGHDRMLVRSAEVIELPLSLEAVRSRGKTVAAGGGGGGGGCIERFIPLERLAAALPEGARYEDAVVSGGPASWGSEPRRVRVAVSSDGGRLCSLCMKPIPAFGPQTLPQISADPSALDSGRPIELGSRTDLFCSRACHDRVSECTSASYVRRKLRDLERGVCQLCGLDCTKLVSALQACRPKGRSAADQVWCRGARMKILERHSAKFLERGFAAQRDRLIAQPIEGNAWQADHIVAVHVGGGCSGLDNMRTLCVCCHKEVTAEQARERARKRREASAPITAAAAAVGRTRVLRRGPPPRGKRRGRKLSDTEDESEGEGEGGIGMAEEEEEKNKKEDKPGRRRRRAKAARYLSDSDSESLEAVEADAGAGKRERLLPRRRRPRGGGRCLSESDSD